MCRETLVLVPSLRMERGLPLQVHRLFRKSLFTSLALTGANSAMKMFQKRDELGTSDMSTKLNTTHQNQVSEVGVLPSYSNWRRNSKQRLLGAPLLWWQGIGRDCFHCRRRRKTCSLGSCCSQDEGSQDLESLNLAELTSLTDGHQNLVQISYISDFLVQNGVKVVMTLSIDFLLIQFPTFINYILLLIW